LIVFQSQVCTINPEKSIFIYQLDSHTPNRIELIGLNVFHRMKKFLCLAVRERTADANGMLWKMMQRKLVAPADSIMVDYVAGRKKIKG